MNLVTSKQSLTAAATELKQSPVVPEQHIAPKGALAPGSRERVCEVCVRQFSKYSCPRCAAAYCSLACYKSHNGQCIEDFSKDQVVASLRSRKSTAEDRRRVVEMLQDNAQRQVVEHDATEQLGQFGIDDSKTQQADSDDDDEPNRLHEDAESTAVRSQLELDFSNLTVEDVHDDRFSVDDLTHEQRAAFNRMLKSGDLADLLQLWSPWWVPPDVDAGTEEPEDEKAGENKGAEWYNNPSESPRKPRTAIAPAHVSGHSAGGGVWFDSDMQLDAARVALVPLPLQLPPLVSIFGGTPSPTLSVVLVDILFAYAFSLRFYNGDWHADVAESCAVILGVCGALSASPAHASVKACVGACMARAAQSWIGAQPVLLASALRDTAQILYFKGSVVRALWHLHQFLNTARLPTKGSRKRSKAASGSIKQPDADAANSAPSPLETRSTPRDSPLAGKRKKPVSHGKASSSSSRQALAAMRRKLYFMLLWANEQSMESLQHVGDEVKQEWQQHMLVFEQGKL